MPITSSKKQRGIGMIEVLIALLIVSVGAIGLLSTQASGKRIGYDALQRSIATGLVRDIVERMRSNPGALANYVATVGESSISTEPSPNCTTASCTPAQMAARDLWEWERALDGAGEYTTNGGQESLAGGLVTPRGCVTNNNGVVTVTVTWKGYQSASNPNPTNTCGAGAGLYGNNDDQRQIIAITTFIEDV